MTEDISEQSDFDLLDVVRARSSGRSAICLETKKDLGEKPQSLSQQTTSAISDVSIGICASNIASDTSMNEDDNSQLKAPAPPGLRRQHPVLSESTPGAYFCGGINSPPLPVNEYDSLDQSRDPEAQLDRICDPIEAGTEDNSGLAVAHQVEAEDNLGALPRAETFDQETIDRKRMIRNRKTITFFFLAAVAAVILVGTLVLALWSESNTLLPESNTPTNAPEEPPDALTIAPTSIELYLLSLMPNVTLDSMKNILSPQARAFQWLLNDTAVNQVMPEARIKQRYSLVTLYFATGGDDWVVKDNWLSHQVHECEWWNRDAFGRKDVFETMFPPYLQEFFPPTEPPPPRCDINSLYNNLWLDANDLHGTLPDELMLLTTMRTVSFGMNGNLEGPIPSSVGQLSLLEGLMTFGMKNAGQVPSEVGALSNLRALILYNGHEGSLPAEIWQLSKLSTFATRGPNTQLSGYVPTEIGLLTHLRWLDHAKSQGTIPSEMGLLTDLEWLEIRETRMEGSLPSELGRLSNLGYFFVRENAFDGSLPTEFGLLTSLKSLALMKCSFSGTIPSELGRLTELEIILSLENNTMTGTIPSELFQLSNLYDFSIADNKLSGSIPTDLALLTSIGSLKLQNNLFDGSLPVQLSPYLQPSLYRVSVEGNPFLTGTVPTALCNISETCIENSIALCGEPGLSFDCTDMLCGCECPCS